MALDGINFNGINKTTAIGQSSATNGIKNEAKLGLMGFGVGVKNDYCVIGRDIPGLQNVVAPFANVPMFEAPDGSQLEIKGALMGCNDEIPAEY